MLVPIQENLKAQAKLKIYIITVDFSLHSSFLSKY